MCNLPDRLSCAWRSHEPLGERAAPSLLIETQNPQIVVSTIERRLRLVGVIRGHPHRDHLITLNEQGAVRTTVRPGPVAVLQPGCDDLGTTTRDVVAFIPRMPAVLSVVGEQGADLVGLIGEPGVCVGVEPPLYLLSLITHDCYSSDATRGGSPLGTMPVAGM
ncbi:MAG TPA: hypothetical protein VFN35_01950 [Ktedonobacteraceae bacterium]|nr:hypothetical protein [Ktedonobacteraceae bacterium]